MRHPQPKHINEPLRAADGVLIFERLDHVEIVFTATLPNCGFTITKEIPLSVLVDLVKRLAPNELRK